MYIVSIFFVLLNHFLISLQCHSKIITFSETFLSCFSDRIACVKDYRINNETCAALTVMVARKGSNLKASVRILFYLYIKIIKK